MRDYWLAVFGDNGGLTAPPQRPNNLPAARIDANLMGRFSVNEAEGVRE